MFVLAVTNILVARGSRVCKAKKLKHTLIIRKEILMNMGLRVTVNHTVPGPTLYVTKGKPVEVTVINEIPDDMTTVHWHGLTQRGTPFSDGVINVTQCPIYNISGFNSMVYTFVPDRIGTFWYHGHVHEQYLDGLFGALIVQDAQEPAMYAAAGAGYTIDSPQWILQVYDYYAQMTGNLLPWYLSPASGGDEPMPDAYMVNGKFSGGSLTIQAMRNGGKVRVRAINTAGISMFKFSIDGMPLTIIELDGEPITPVDVSSFSMNVAQRVSFVLDFSRIHSSLASSPALWIRFEGMPQMYPTYNESAPALGKQL
jgi:FtsP/CotA-like multicopper oxidase with cupredoxin domain